VWYHISGLRNLLAVLHDSLAILPRGQANYAVPIPALDQLEESRVERFLELATLVVSLEVHTKSNRWVRWTGMERLIALLPTTGPDQRVLFPRLQRLTLVFEGGPRRGELASYVRLGASSSLRVLSIDPLSTRAYQACMPAEARAICDALARFQNPQAPTLRTLSLFPEELNGALREQVMTSLMVVSSNLSSLSISAWLLSQDTMAMLANLPLRSLLIQGRFPINSGDLSQLQNLDCPATAFQGLRRLILSNVQFADMVNLLATPRLLDCVELLRVDVAQVHGLDDNEEALYTRLIELVAGSQTNSRLVLVARQGTREGAYPLTEAMFSLIQVKAQVYTHLRLYNFCLHFSEGFRVFHEGQDNWQNLTQLSVMQQDLHPADLVAFAAFPNLSRLSANVSRALGRRRDGALDQVFAHPLTLASRFTFGERYVGMTDQVQALRRIVCLLLDLCSNGLNLRVEREFCMYQVEDVQDHRWLELLAQQLRE
ncbi:hypothetical protein FRC09_017186, partial [Ceratobasidium sp. 395]